MIRLVKSDAPSVVPMRLEIRDKINFSPCGTNTKNNFDPMNIIQNLFFSVYVIEYIFGLLN